MTPQPRITADKLSVAYGTHRVLHDLDVAIPTGQVTAIVGPNGCGKSTLLRTLARVLTPVSGHALLDGRSIHRLPTRQVARQIGLLPQGTTTPEQLTVAELVARGRYPYRGSFGRWTDHHQAAVDDALDATATSELRHRPVDQLSGGQRQRVWIAMVLAQQTPLLLLDEPTTYLDLAHRLDILRLLCRLNAQRGVTVVMVIHDLHDAARHAHNLIAISDGRIIAQGPPTEIITPLLVYNVFGVHCTTIPDPVTGAPLVVPLDPAHDSCAIHSNGHVAQGAVAAPQPPLAH